MQPYDCRPCGFRAEALGDEESVSIRSCPRCGRRNVGSVLRFFAVAVLWCLAILIVSGGIAHQTDWRAELTWPIGIAALVLVAFVAFKRANKWRRVRARVVFITPEPRSRVAKEVQPIVSRA